MKHISKKFLTWIFYGALVLCAALVLLSFAKTPKSFTYGVSFSKLHADELGLDWKKVFIATLDDLKIKHYRLSAHWPNTEPQKGNYDFRDLDFQMNEARKRNADVILSVGRRLPGWPECHEPDWANSLSNEEKRTELLKYIEVVVTRYKDYQNLAYWQVENEAFLHLYATENCGDFFTLDFFEQEIALVKKLDPTTPIFLTDSGELSLWYQAYTRADTFGTSLYLYVWSHTFGPIRYPITPAFFRIKRNIVSLIFGSKPVVLSELSLEPWLLKPIYDTPLDVQLSRMDIRKFNNILSFAKKAAFDTQYLWGVEWWYYMKEKNHPEFWERAREVYGK